MPLDSLQQYIRFAISQLSPQNSQAEFEKICLYFSRQRIHSNILPATGPVQAGGDQGRDFETFHTYLSKSTIKNSSFVAEHSDKPVVFACSMEKNPTKKNGKIFTDVRTITGGGVAVDRIYFFSGQDIPVAARHKSIADVKRDFKVDLEIIDANALAQHLSEPDLFWVATQFLKIPADNFPVRNDEGWYAKLLKEYKAREKPITTYEEFEDVKSAIRHIYKDKDLKSDLPLWYPKLNELIADIPFEALVRKAIYERFVTAFVGLEYVEGQEGNIERYFRDFERYISNSELEDANHLLTFCQTAVAKGRLNLSKTYLDGIGTRIDMLITELTANAVTTDNKCALLEIRASFNLNDRRLGPDFERNFGLYIASLQDLIDNLEDAHFFPFERLADRLNKNIKVLLRITDDIGPLERIAKQVDDILSKKGSAAIVGSKLRDRAVAFIDAGQIGRGLRVLHELKIKWFNQETMEGCIVTCLLIGTAYKRQGLYYASKYYNLVGAYLAHKSKDSAQADKIVQGLSQAAECDYATGAWVSYLGLTETLLNTHVLVTKDFDIYDSDETMQILYYPSVIFKTIKTFLPAAEPVLKTAVPLFKELEQDLEEIDDQFLQDLTPKSLRESAENEIAGVPFNDISEARTIVFNACGCDWRFSFSNSYENTLLAEEYIGIFQVVLQELADDDLHLRPGKVSINMSIMKGAKFSVQEKEGTISVSLVPFTGTTYEQRRKYTFDLMVYAQMLLYLQSSLPDKEYQKILDPKLKKPDLLEKTSFGQSYEVVAKEFYKKEIVQQVLAAGLKNPFAEHEQVLALNKYLPWRTDISPLYKSKVANELITQNIEKCSKALAVSLPLLKQSGWFQEIVTALRQAGWLDWQLLYAIAYLVVNKKVNLMGKARTQHEFEHLFKEYLLKDESDWYHKIDQNLLNREELEQELQTLLPISLLKDFGLDNKSSPPDFPGILEVLTKRFKFMEDGKDIILFND